MTNRYAEDIRKIAGTKDTKGGLSAQEERDALLAKRGIGYIDANGTVQGQSGGSTTTRKPDSPLTPSDKSALDGTNPEEALAGEPPAEEGENEYDAEDLLNKEEGTPGISDKTDAFGEAINNKGVINKITGVDCSTGDEVEIGLVPDFPPPDAFAGNDTSPPSDEWEDANTPPVLKDYEAGFYWLTTAPGPTFYREFTPTVYSAYIPIYTATNRGPVVSGGGGPGTHLGPNSFGNYVIVTNIVASSPTQWDIKMKNSNSNGDELGAEFTAFFVTKTACTGVTSYCPIEPPRETSWPADGVVSYKKAQTSGFQTSVYDPDAPPGSEALAGGVNFCGATSGDPMRAETGANGVTLLYKTDGEGGPILADTQAVVISTDNTVQGYVDAANISDYQLR